MIDIKSLRRSSDPLGQINNIRAKESLNFPAVGQTFKTPLDVDATCSKLGIHFDFSVRGIPPKYNAIVRVDDSGPCSVRVNPSLMSSKFRYYGALAIGTCVCAPEGEYVITSKVPVPDDRIRESVYNFAYGILVPGYPLGSKHSVDDIPHLAEMFGIPSIPMAMIYGRIFGK